jgi:hypothetical protein
VLPCRLVEIAIEFVDGGIDTQPAQVQLGRYWAQDGLAGMYA